MHSHTSDGATHPRAGRASPRVSAVFVNSLMRRCVGWVICNVVEGGRRRADAFAARGARPMDML
ncbi:hypothetical protein FRAAL4632 [Frankia alni ACN14a]|uniref:Uncharacterized protein n=1 Tax=Frankia alni (strain DSM 45986 / CECT 9034 / ACN14a) TaxID=326424 RepID=Q0RGW2_FRAAA|nr:hypothetical protein FRAAL4632 [Frankia alni ACN14a]